MFVYYVSGLTLLFGVSLIGFSLMMDDKKTKTESEQDAQQPSKAAAETISA